MEAMSATVTMAVPLSVLVERVVIEGGDSLSETEPLTAVICRIVPEEDTSSYDDVVTSLP